MTEENKFHEYFDNNKDEVFKKINKVYQDNINDIEVDVFSITPELLKIVENDLKNPIDKPELIPEFREFLIKNLTLYDDEFTKHSPLHYSTKKGIDSFNYASPELYKPAFYQLVSVYVWCKYFIEFNGYSGVLPISSLII